MKKQTNIIFIIYIILTIGLIVCSSIIIYKTIYKVNIMPNATGVLINEQINIAKEFSDINELKQFITNEFENQERLIRKNDSYINTILLLSIVVFLLTLVCFILTFIISKRLKRTQVALKHIEQENKFQTSKNQGN